MFFSAAGVVEVDDFRHDDRDSLVRWLVVARRRSGPTMQKTAMIPVQLPDRGTEGRGERDLSAAELRRERLAEDLTAAVGLQKISSVAVHVRPSSGGELPPASRIGERDRC